MAYGDHPEILIVEDSPTQAEQLRHILEVKGFPVLQAGNGREALAILSERHPALVVSDVKMPEMDGYELCLHINGDEKLRDVPVILVTTLTDPRDVIKGLESGAVGFVSKPYERRNLLSLIANVLANKDLYTVKEERTGLNISFAGGSYHVTSGRPQILSFLLSTYENAIQKNEELLRANLKLQNAQIKLAQQAEELEALSIHDELTGLYNRRGLHALADHQRKIAVRAGARLILCYADLDEMKQINDVLGHDAGDKALIAVAETLRATARQSDLIARIGGDEFVVLGISDGDDGAVFGERLDQALGDFNRRQEIPFALSLSIGLSVFDPNEMPPLEEALKEADEKMYQVKMSKKGR